jgi:hypothetical protein
VTQFQMPVWWVSALWMLRICATLMLVSSGCMTALDYQRFGFGLWSGIAAITCACNIALTYVEWFVFQPQWPGRRLRHGILGR